MLHTGIYFQVCKKTYRNMASPVSYTSWTNRFPSRIRNRYCGELTAVGQSFWETSVGFLLPQNSSLTKPMSWETLLLQEQDKLISSKASAEREQCQEITDATLNWDKLKVRRNCSDDFSIPLGS